MKSITNFNEANAYVWRFHNAKETKYSLDNMKRLMDYLGNPQDNIRIVHVAGTSGKTSTSYYASSFLAATGTKVGLTVSPIVDEINERVQINGQPLGESVFCRALSRFSELIDKASVRPSSFELMMAFAYWYFDQVKVDYAVIEVGLGGLRDASNVVDRPDKVCVITDIGFDHVNVLGRTLREITIQKAGIIHKDNVVFVYRQGAEVMETLAASALKQGGRLSIIDPIDNQSGFMPDFQFRNWYLASKVFDFIQARDGLSKLSGASILSTKRLLVPGRMDVWHFKDKTIVMDGAHNPQKMAAFVSSFKKLYPNQKPVVLIAMRRGKEYKEVARIVSPIASKVITTDFSVKHDAPINSLAADKLAEVFRDKVETVVAPNPDEALRQLLGSNQKLLVITGSIYLLSQIRGSELLEA